MYKIPSEKSFVIPSKSDVLGNIYTGRNLDLTSNDGRIRIGQSMFVNTGSNTVAEITAPPAAFKYYNDGTGSKFYTLAGTSGLGYVFRGGAGITTAFTKMGGSAPTTLDSAYSDMEVAFGKLYVSGKDGKVYNYDTAQNWANITAGSSTPFIYATMLHFSVFMDRMYCSKNGYQIQSWDVAESVVSPGSDYALEIPDNYTITFIRSSSNRVWIGALHNKGGRGAIFEWNGVSQEYQNIYELNTRGAMSGVVKNDVLSVIDSSGNILTWNGGTFVKVAGLNRKNNLPLFNASSLVNDRFVHPNGMSIIRDKIHVLIDGVNFNVADHRGTQEDTIPSGVYEYDEQKGLIHKHSFILTRPADLVVDYGQVRLAGVGALTNEHTPFAVTTTDGTFLAGVGVYTGFSAKEFNICYDNNFDTLRKSFTLITPKLDTQGVLDTWQKVYLLFTELSGDDKLVLKYRKVEDEPLEENAFITWTSTTTFTTNSSISLLNYIGAEVEIMEGRGGGMCSHITNVTKVGATYTVTVDEIHPEVTGGTGKVRYSKWIKLGVAEEENFKELALGFKNTWLQFKLWGMLTGKKEIEQIQVINDVFKPSA
jgi:hypothetical protein